MRLFFPFFCLIAICAVGCGTPGAPLPPSTGIPKPVSDLQAVRKGDTVTLTWSAPTETTDGELIRKPGKMQLSRTISGNNTAQVSQAIAELPLPSSLKEQETAAPVAKDSLTSILQQSTPGGDFAVYTVLAQSRSGKSAGPSNQVIVPLVLTPRTPQRVQATAVPLGISIAWDQAWPPEKQSMYKTQYAYRIMRRIEGSSAATKVAQVIVGNEAVLFVDSGIDWEKHYEYWITPVTLWQEGETKKGEVEGDDSPVAAVFAHDIFPPAAPTALQAVFSEAAQQPFIDLTWTSNTEPDLAGYNIYRHGTEEQPVKINTELVKTSAYRDAAVRPGAKYFYSVSAIDLRGNESAKSQETSETVPKE
jgi:hypothetical protein